MPYLTLKAHDAIRTAARGYTWPGGYPTFAIMADGESLCPDCLIGNLRLVVQATHDSVRDDWAIQAAEVNWEDGRLYCANCYNPIPSAYGEDPEEQERIRAIAMPLPEDDQP
jgi:hypothetical protein